MTKDTSAIVFLIHGFRSDSSSMALLARHLRKTFLVCSVELPLSFQSLETNRNELERIVMATTAKHPGASCHFVGHSAGGIVIMMLLANAAIASQTKSCVFIAIPADGTELAELHELAVPPILKEISMPIRCLTSSAIRRLNLKKPIGVQYAGIAGIKPWAHTNMFFDGLMNDGVVSLRSALAGELDAKAILPFHHTEITNQFITCKLVRQFIQTLDIPSKFMEVSLMDMGRKFKAIVESGYQRELCSELNYNLETATAGGKVWWNLLAEQDGWKLQQNKLSGHIRILNPEDIRKGWGGRRAMTSAIDLVYSRMRVDDECDGSP